MILDAAPSVVGYVLLRDTNTSIYIDGVSLSYGSEPIPYDDRAVMAAGTIGGTGTAGAGKQYVSIIVDGVAYKVLHDN
jgi:hypothetical protein